MYGVVFMALQSVMMFLCLGKLEEAIQKLTDAILLNPTSAIMYATRGMLAGSFSYLLLLRIHLL